MLSRTNRTSYLRQKLGYIFSEFCKIIIIPTKFCNMYNVHGHSFSNYVIMLFDVQYINGKNMKVLFTASRPQI